MSVTINDKMLTKVYRLVEEEEGQECWHWEEGEVHHVEEEEGPHDPLLDHHLVIGLHGRGEGEVYVTCVTQALLWLAESLLASPQSHR